MMLLHDAAHLQWPVAAVTPLVQVFENALKTKQRMDIEDLSRV